MMYYMHLKYTRDLVVKIFASIGLYKPIVEIIESLTRKNSIEALKKDVKKDTRKNKSICRY